MSLSQAKPMGPEPIDGPGNSLRLVGVTQPATEAQPSNGEPGGAQREQITLLCHAAQYDPNARKKLFALIHAELRGIALRGKNRNDLERLRALRVSDLVQDAIVRMLQWDLANKGRRQFYFALGLAVEQSLIAQAKKIKRAGLVELAPEVAELVGADSGELHDRLTSEDRLTVASALQTLEQTNPDDAEAFRLSHYVGLDRLTICDILGIEPPVLHGRLQRARKSLRTSLGTTQRSTP